MTSHSESSGATRREFVQILGAGLLIAVLAEPSEAQNRRGGGNRGGGGRAGPVSARLHIAKDGAITLLVGKVEAGQGARAELTQVAAEELRVPADRITLIMADTAQVPDDGITAGSGTTPRTVPAVQQACAAARAMLIASAVKQWNITADKVEVKDGKVIDADGKRELSYGDLITADGELLAQNAPANVDVTPVKEWKVMGAPLARPNARDLVTGNHLFPSDMVVQGGNKRIDPILRGKILRPASYGAKLTAIDMDAAKAVPGAIATQDGDFVGVIAPSSFAAQQALDLLAASAKWEKIDQPPSSEIFDYLAKHAHETPANPFADEMAKANKSFKQTYHVAYVQHAPLGPRAACAAWDNGKLTVWTGTQNPFGVRGELMKAFNLPADSVRVIVPDFGGGFGGKHSGECAVEAAKLAKAAGKPVALRWTRQEEFTWAYFRPAAVINAEASLDRDGNLSSWHFININSGPSGVESPYRIPKSKSLYVPSNPPLRQGSYRALAATANHFARESFMDELASAAGRDPLEFRLGHLDNPRLKAVLEEAAKRFDWTNRIKNKQPNVGIGLSCGTEKGSYVAACVEVAIQQGEIKVRHVTQAFECGAIVNPGNLMSQVQGAIVMGLGPALRESIEFKNGVITNASFTGYRVPRFSDLPVLDVHLLDRKDLPSAGAGETPIVAVAPAIANAVCNLSGHRLRSLPIRLPA